MEPEAKLKLKGNGGCVIVKEVARVQLFASVTLTE